jgi:hypothetical protein
VPRQEALLPPARTCGAAGVHDGAEVGGLGRHRRGGLGLAQLLQLLERHRPGVLLDGLQVGQVVQEQAGHWAQRQPSRAGPAGRAA